VSEQKTELQMILEHARKTGNYPVVEWLLKSWIPYKTELELRLKEKNSNGGV